MSTFPKAKKKPKKEPRALRQACTEGFSQRQIRRIIYSAGYSDRIICESVSQVSREDVITLLNQPVCVSDVPDVEKGEVLVDSRGQGSFQR